MRVFRYLALGATVVIVASCANRSATPTQTTANVRLKLTPVARTRQALAVARRTNDPTLYVAEKDGRIEAVREGRIVGTVLDISSEVSAGYEQGLLGLAFAPDGDKFYINFTNTEGDTVIREYRFARGRAIDGSARELLAVDQPFDNHNGGQMLFGPDGYLYVGLGDGGTGKGTGGDPLGNAQNKEVLLGKILRIDPRPAGDDAYRIPPDNPFFGKPGRDEIWGFGLRNPWRFSFDRQTNDLWIGDVGQHIAEEIDFEPADSGGGRNYGWSAFEGFNRYQRKGGSTPKPAQWVRPVYVYGHPGGNCAVIGGVVYRGRRIPALRGAYLFADHCTGKVQMLRYNGSRVTQRRFAGAQVPLLSSFAEDARGEVYVTSLQRGLLRLEAA